MKKGFKMAEENRDTAASTQPASSSETEHACNCGCGVVDDAIDMMPDEELLYDLADLFKIFGDSTRIKILYALLRSELCVCDIADLLGLTQSAISHQLRILKHARMVKNRRAGKVVYYSLADDHIKTLFEIAFDHVMED